VRAAELQLLRCMLFININLTVGEGGLAVLFKLVSKNSLSSPLKVNAGKPVLIFENKTQ